MPQVVDYPSLTQSMADWLHRGDLTSGSTPFSDYFVQLAQEQIESDIADLNMGNGIGLQESSYGPFPIVNGVVPVPTDYLGMKLLYVADGVGGQYTLNERAASWIYDTYSNRGNGGIPAYFGRDVWQSSYAMPQTFTVGAGTSFTLSGTPSTASLVLVSLDGVTLTAGTDYNISGTTLTLTFNAIPGQVLAVNYLSTSSGTQAWIAATNQVSFALNNPSASITLATLDGSILTEGTDYSVAGGFIVLEEAPLAGQTLTVYYAIGSVFIFGPSPDGPYSVAGTYYARAPILSASNTVTTNWMVASAPSMFLACCLAQAAKFLKDVPTYQLWSADYQQRLKALVDRDKAANWSAGTLAMELA